MAAIIPLNRIGSETLYRHTITTENHEARRADHHAIKSKHHCSRSLPIQKKEFDTDFNYRLQAHEFNARRKFLEINKTLSFEKLPGWLDGMLNQSVLPTLQRIGFDAPVTRALFQMAISSWKLMGPLNEKIIFFQPAIVKEIEEVRQGIKVKAGNGGNRLLRPEDATDRPILGTINNRATPENLFDLFDEIGTPWIILPRASRFLAKQHCQYLPAYLKTIERETNAACLMLFARITAEFLGNYALKFADGHHPPQKLTKLLFYGYSALFWKNLRCPPAGSHAGPPAGSHAGPPADSPGGPPENLANCAAFVNFLNWVKRLARKNEFLGTQAENIVDQMINLKAMAFPSRNPIHS